MADHFEILDACALLNLYASGSLEAILKSRHLPCCVVEQVKQESLFIRKPSDTSTGYEYEPVVLDGYFQSGLLNLVKLESEIERELFVNLAAQIDDGEAATIAIAIARNMQVVTDDKKAVRVLKQEAPKLIWFSTLDVVKTWSETGAISPAELRTALLNILKHANYLPGKKHHLLNWWQIAVNT